MKKLIAILMAAVMVIAFAACAKTPTTDEDNSVADTQADVQNNAEETSEAATSGESVAQTLASEFKTLAAAGTDAQTVAEKLAASNAVSAISPAAILVEEGYLTGFDNVEITGFESGFMFAPMIGTIPFVGYVFYLSEGTDADAFVKNLEDNANLRWNICTQADEMASAVEGNLVFFVMAPMSLEA